MVGRAVIMSVLWVAATASALESQHGAASTGASCRGVLRRMAFAQTPTILLRTSPAYRSRPQVKPELQHAGGRRVALEASTLFEIEQAVSASVSAELTHVSPVSALILFVAGVLTSLSPCALSVLPLTVGYIGGVSGGKGGTLLPSIAFTLGLASSLSALGLAAAFLGQVYGAESGGALPTFLALASAGLFVTMGLTLLEILPLPQLLPSSAIRADQNEGDDGNGLKGLGVAYLFGASTALVASPCATPVLASLLAFITSSGTDPAVGAALLVAYSLGYSSPIFAAGLATGTVKELVSLKTKFLWVTPASGSMLLAYGTYSALDHLFPQ